MSCILCMVLIVAMALITGGCSNKTEGGTSQSAVVQEQSTGEVQVLGEGNQVFPLTVTDADGKETLFEIHTDQTTVGEALLELGLLEGEEGPHGLYVKKVNGITADYDTNGVYWAFYINGEYAQTGVDSTEITKGDSYSFKVE